MDQDTVSIYSAFTYLKIHNVERLQHQQYNRLGDVTGDDGNLFANIKIERTKDNRHPCNRQQGPSLGVWTQNNPLYIADVDDNKLPYRTSYPCKGKTYHHTEHHTPV